MREEAVVLSSRRSYVCERTSPPWVAGRILVCGHGLRGAFRPRPGILMSQRCELCGKGPLTGNNVSHSKVHTKRRFLPNLHAATVVVKGRQVKAKLCTRCIRTQAKAAR